jgi:type II secretory pathway component PulF
VTQAPPPFPRDARFARPVRPDYGGVWLVRTPRGFDGFTLWAHLSGWALAAALVMGPCLFILPRYEAMLKDFNAEVPQTTLMALGAARWLRTWGIVFAPVALAHSALVAVWFARASLTSRRLYRLVLTLCVCAAGAVVILALFLPIISITNSLSGGVTTK